MYAITFLLKTLLVGSFWLTTLTVTSPDFKAGMMIPSVFSCKGKSISPALHISTLPSGTVSLAIIVHDPDAPHAGGFTHWVSWNIDPATDIPQAFKGGVQGANGAGQPGYTGPCPPSGVHHYHFMVYALDTRLSLDATTDKAGLEKAMDSHILAHGDLVGLFKADN